MHSIRPVDPKDVAEVVSAASQDSLRAIRMLGVTDIEGTVKALVHASFLSKTVEHQGSPLAVFGFVPTSATAASVWLIAIDNLPELPPSLIAQAKEYLKEASQTYPQLTTAVWERNEDHIRWVQWLGFKETGHSTINGEVFLSFTFGEP